MKTATKMPRPMKPIPVSAAEKIARDYGYDQVIVIARRCDEEPGPAGEHVTTYGKDKTHCSVAAKVGNYIKHKIMGWPEHSATGAQEAIDTLTRLGYTYHGGVRWKPPIGPRPTFEEDVTAIPEMQFGKIVLCDLSSNAFDFVSATLGNRTRRYKLVPVENVRDPV